MIVVADTTALNYLVLIGEQLLIPELYGGAVIPPAVHRELLNAHTPELVRSWVLNPPAWLAFESPRPATINLVDPALDPGEREASHSICMPISF